MSFFALVLKNLTRQRTRAVLTVLGIGIGITTVVALGVITGGFRETAQGLLRSGGTDFMVAQEGAADLTLSTVDARDRRALARQPGVERSMGTLMHVARVGDNPFFIALGVEPRELAEAPPAVIEGTTLKRGEPDQILLGERAAADLGVGVGNDVTIEDRELAVTGVFESDNAWEASGGYVPLPTVQEIARKPGLLTAVYVKAAPGTDPVELQASIEREYPQLTAIADVEEYGDVDQGIEVLDAANLAISLLAVGIGAIGVMNTMVMSVFERTREFGILRAVGWRGRRIIRMVILESLLLCLIAALLGTLLGVLATRALVLVPAVGSFLDPQYAPEVFVRALLVGVVVALAGAAYPAFRAVRLTPMEALRHE